MRRMSKTFGLLIVLTICLSTQLSEAQYGGGTGESNDPYLIYTAEQMNTIGAEPNDWNKHFKLMADIDLAQYTGEQFNIIGYNRGFRDNKPFRGVFDGNNKTISNFTYISSDIGNNGTHTNLDEGDFGIFGHVIWAHIKDLRIKDPNMILPNGRHVGVLAGSFHNGTITRCSVEGGRIYAKQYVGGLVGQNSGTITECSSTTTVSADSESGGLVGTNSGDISFCYTTSSVKGGGWIGGFVGRNHGTISQCHSHSIVSGLGGSGGLVGYNERGQIDLCYSLGSISGQRTIGGLCGSNNANVSSCYSAADVTGTGEITGGLIGSNYGSVIASKATGNVQGVDYVGGLVAANGGLITHCYARGSVHGNNRVSGLGNGTILFSYSTGLVSGNDNVSGFAGSGSTYLCYWDTEISKVNRSAAGKGRTTVQMQSAKTYRGWGYGGHWIINDGNDYPRLIWENTPGEMLVDPPRIYGGGTGEPNNPYQIHTAQQFVSIAYYFEDFDKNFILTNDIDLSTINPDEIIPIGTNRRIFFMSKITIGYSFEGSFAGNSHTISNFTCHENGEDSTGVFGYIGQNGNVDNLRIENISVSGSRYTGGLAGNNLGIIRRCSIAGTVEGSKQVGSLVGSNEGFIIECSTSGQVAGNEDVGGIVGYNGKDILASYSQSNVKGNKNIGGTVGKNGDPKVWTSHAAPPPGYVPLPADCSISSCYSVGFIEGKECVGGLIGENGGFVKSCYSVASITDTKLPSNDQTNVGGLVGSNNWGEISNSFWDVDISRQITSAGGTGKTTSEMQIAGTFLEADWDFMDETENGTEDIWWILEGQEYPRLFWELIEDNQ